LEPKTGGMDMALSNEEWLEYFTFAATHIFESKLNRAKKSSAWTHSIPGMVLGIGLITTIQTIIPHSFFVITTTSSKYSNITVLIHY
jgi:hypothetical protein